MEREEVVKRLKELQSTDDNELSQVFPPSEDLFCNDCDKNYVELVKCTKCGSLVCGDCATDTIDGRILCKHCYEEMDGMFPISSDEI